MMANEAIVAIKDLNHFYGEGELRKQTLFGINLVVRPQEFIIITGPSGSGKTTLLSLIGCLRAVQKGSLKIFGQELKGATNPQLVTMRRNFGYITQASNLLNFLTAQQNVQMSLELHPGLLPQEIREKAQAMLELVGLGDRLNYYPNRLSIGQRQRVAIACALVTQPKLVLADEPTAALDKVSGRNVVTLMHRLAKEQGSAVIVVTHDNRILDVADRIINVEDGKLGLALSHELSIALPGFDETLLTNAIAAKNSTGESIPIIQPKVLTFAPGEIVIQQGELATKFYVLLEGIVEVWKETPDQSPKLLNRLTRGEYFGEIGLLEGSERTATVQVAKAAEAKIIVIEKDFFQLMMENSDQTSSDVARRMNQRVLKSHLTNILPNLELENLDRAIAKVKVVYYGPNSNIIQPGDSPQKFYVLAKGKVQILRQDRSGVEIPEKTIFPGETFGARELIVGENYSYTVRVLPKIEAEVMVLEKKVFSELMVAAYSKLIFTSDTELDRVASVLHRRLMKKMSKS